MISNVVKFVQEPQLIKETKEQQRKVRALVAKLKMKQNEEEFKELLEHDKPIKRYAKNARRDCEFPKKSLYDVCVNAVKE